MKDENSHPHKHFRTCVRVCVTRLFCCSHSEDTHETRRCHLHCGANTKCDHKYHFVATTDEAPSRNDSLWNEKAWTWFHRTLIHPEQNDCEWDHGAGDTKSHTHEEHGVDVSTGSQIFRLRYKRSHSCSSSTISSRGDQNTYRRAAFSCLACDSV